VWWFRKKMAKFTKMVQEFGCEEQHPLYQRAIILAETRTRYQDGKPTLGLKDLVC
jgi:hypothetical protein